MSIRSVDYSLFHPIGRAVLSLFPNSFQSWLPYVSSIDVIDEIVIISNPSNSIIDLTGYTLCDLKKRHAFKFPPCKLDGNSDIRIYCCPGLKHKHFEFIEPYLLWTNSDGSLRRKEVLNNGISLFSLY